MVDKYGVAQDVYCYPGTTTLINKLNITEQLALNQAELKFTHMRAEQFVPEFTAINFGTFQHIHAFLFQDLYAWAGQIRTVDISKGHTRFANMRFIENEANKLFRQLAQENFLADTSETDFPARFAHYYSELNVIHPFRDGNGRAQRILFEILAIHAGYEIRWKLIRPDEWLSANIDAYRCHLDPLIAELQRGLIKLVP